MEEWKPVVEFESLYEVSNLGRIRRIDTSQIRIATKLKSGYLHLHLYCRNEYHGRYLHLLVLDAFKGPKPLGLEGRHLDGNQDNCSSSNLEWGTSQENSVDTLKHGNNKQAKLTDEQVRYLRRLPARGEKTLSEIANQFGISDVTLHNVRSRRTYSHVED